MEKAGEKIESMIESYDSVIEWQLASVPVSVPPMTCLFEPSLPEKSHWQAVVQRVALRHRSSIVD